MGVFLLGTLGVVAGFFMPVMFCCSKSSSWESLGGWGDALRVGAGAAADFAVGFLAGRGGAPLFCACSSNSESAFVILCGFLGPCFCGAAVGASRLTVSSSCDSLS